MTTPPSPVKKNTSVSKKRKRVPEWSLVESPDLCLLNTAIERKEVTPLSKEDQNCIQTVEVSPSSCNSSTGVIFSCSTIIYFMDGTRCTLLYARNVDTDNDECCESCKGKSPIKTMCTLCESILCGRHDKCMKFVRNDTYYQMRRKEMTDQEGLPEEAIPGERMCICNSCWNVYYILAFQMTQMVNDKGEKLRKCTLLVPSANKSA